MFKHGLLCFTKELETPWFYPSKKVCSVLVLSCINTTITKYKIITSNYQKIDLLVSALWYVLVGLDAQILLY